MIKNLREFVNINQLQELQEQFAEALGVAVLVCDAQGNPLTEPSRFTGFCKYVRSCKEGLARCILSDNSVGKLAAQSKRPVIHRCHTGLVDFAAPIILRDTYLGSILCGQVLLQEEELQELEGSEMNTEELPLDLEKLQELYKHVEKKSRSRIQSIAELLFVTANYIVKLGDNYLATKELSEKNEKLMKELKHRSELEQLLKDTQLKVLQAQVNPHFLFNTLNTISRLAYLENAAQTEKMTYSLGKILRYSLRNIEQLITLDEELEYLRHYLSIQQTRYRDLLNVTITVQEGLQDFKIPIFTLQPIVENSIVHGFESTGNPMTIAIEVLEDDQMTVINISDTGRGIRKDSCDLPKSTGAGHTTKIGLTNVNKRLQYYFGEEWGINKLKQLPHAGTLVQIQLPLFRKSV